LNGTVGVYTLKGDNKMCKKSENGWVDCLNIGAL